MKTTLNLLEMIFNAIDFNQLEEIADSVGYPLDFDGEHWDSKAQSIVDRYNSFEINISGVVTELAKIHGYHEKHKAGCTQIEYKAKQLFMHSVVEWTLSSLAEHLAREEGLNVAQVAISIIAEYKGLQEAYPNALH